MKKGILVLTIFAGLAWMGSSAEAGHGCRSYYGSYRPAYSYRSHYGGHGYHGSRHYGYRGYGHHGYGHRGYGHRGYGHHGYHGIGVHTPGFSFHYGH